MGIEKYYNQALSIYSNDETLNSNGVYKKARVFVKEILGRLDLNSTTRVYASDKETYETVFTLFTAYDTEIKKGRIINNGVDDFDIISPVDAFSSQHHMEVKIVQSGQ